MKQTGPSIRASIPTLIRHAAFIWAIVAIEVFAAAQEKQLAIYAPQTQYRVSVIDRPSGEYVGLLDVLEPLGKIESHTDGKKWKLRFTPAKSAMEAEFEAGKRTGKIRGSKFDLTGEFFLQSDRGYIPIASLPNLLPRLLERTVDLHAASRRLFLGGAGLKYTLELRHNPNRLVVTFPSAVSPNIVPNGNRVRLVFTREPILSSGTNTVIYNEPPIVSSDFIESNGSAILEFVGSAPLQASLSDGGRVVTITAVTQAAAQEPAAQTPTPETPLPPPAIPPTTPAATATVARKGTLVVIDPGHGGDERGAQLTDKLNEKDVTLALARRIQHELENHGFSVLLLRTGDTTLTADQRASAANAAHPGFYLGLHAATLGTGVRIYTAMLPATPAANRRTFLPWESAQAPYLDQSTAAATAIAAEFTNRKIPVRSLASPLRPLNNIAGIALAVEIAPEGDSVESINDAKYQQNVAAAVAAGIAASRGKLESQ